MGNWPALLVAPSLALTNLTVTYALLTPSCAHQSMLAPTLASAASLAACAWMSLGAWRNWRAARVSEGPAAGDSDTAPARPPFLALVATMVGAFSCLAVLTQWFPQWVLSPCAS
jgi:hypothetical protein